MHCMGRGPGGARRGWAPLAAVAMVLAVTGWAVLGGATPIGAEGQTAVDSAAATIGVLLGYVLLGRFWESRRISDLLLCAFLLLLGCSNAVFSVLPRVLGDAPGTGASAVAGILAGAAFAGASWLPPWRWHGRPMLAVLVLVLGVLLLLAVAAVVALAGRGKGSIDTFGSTPDVGLTIAQLCAAALFCVGALGAARRARADELLRWLAVAGLLAVGSRVDFAVSASIGDAWSAAGTMLRIGFYGALLVACGLEIRTYWHRVADVAVLEERRRIARDLHDGLAQELAFAATQSRALAERSEHPTRARLIAAATERALDESRRAIAALTRPLDEPLEVALAQCAEEVCDRFDAQLVLDAKPGLLVDSDRREALLRITREAVNNAVRHGAAGAVTIRLRGPHPLSLAVEDDGLGFDPSDLRHLSGRFGLVSMRERTEAMGGTFCLVSRYSGGTTVEVILP